MLTNPLIEQYTDLQLSTATVKGHGNVTPGDSFIIKLMQLLFSYAIEVRASDLHIEPTQEGAHVRYRIDGVLQEMLQLSVEVREPLIRAIKTKAALTLDAVGRSKPQDGRLDVQLDSKILDVRLSSFPTIFGDTLAMRFFDHTSSRLQLAQLGISPSIWKSFQQTIRRSNGLLLVTGPTNSGKTTTLYAVLEQLRSPHVKIVTLEDPVEYQMDGINQGQINPQVGLTFASGLRAILRQDANIILLGEIRDRETVEIAIRAALTGHLVLSSLHTKHACGAVIRLLDMGVEPHLIISAIIGVLAMRLVRLVCPACAVSDPLGAQTVARLVAEGFAKNLSQVLSSPTVTLRKGKGCAACNGTGYKNRTAVFEFLTLSGDLKYIILEKSLQQLYAGALKSGMVTMLEDGLEKACQGLTTVEEVLRVAGDTTND